MQQALVQAQATAARAGTPCAELDQTKRYLARVQQELSQLKETPSNRLGSALAVLREKQAGEDIQALREAIRQTKELREMHPGLPESRAAVAQLTKAEATVDRLEKRDAAQQKEAKAAADRTAKQGEARTQIEKAITDSAFAEAKRLLSANAGLLGDSGAAALRKAVADKEFQPKDVSLKEIKNLGTELIGRRVRVRCLFGGLTEAWATSLPSGSYRSPEGLVYSFKAAEKWMHYSIYMIGPERESFLYVHAPKEKFRDQLMAMREDTVLTIVGRVIDFGTNNRVALIVEELE